MPIINSFILCIVRLTPAPNAKALRVLLSSNFKLEKERKLDRINRIDMIFYNKKEKS